jgi:hypothetical protein
LLKEPAGKLAREGCRKSGPALQQVPLHDKRKQQKLAMFHFQYQ